MTHCPPSAPPATPERTTSAPPTSPAREARPHAGHLATWSAHASDIASAMIEHVSLDIPRLAPTPTHLSLLGRDAQTAALSPDVHLVSPGKLGVRERAVAVGLALHPFTLTPETVIADHTAAWVWCGGPCPDTLTVSAHSRRRPPPGVISRQLTLFAGDVLTVAGCPVLAPHRVFAELLAGEPGIEDVRWARELLTRGWLSAEELRHLSRQRKRLARHLPNGRRSGAVRYRRLARHARRLTESEEPEAQVFMTLPSEVTR